MLELADSIAVTWKNLYMYETDIHVEFGIGSAAQSDSGDLSKTVNCT